jgi:cell division protein FtsL
MIAVALVVMALLSVVVAHSMLAQGQVGLTAAQSQMAAEEAIHRQLLTKVAEAENPAQIVAEAKKLNLVPPANVKQLPAVPLNVPIGQTTTSTTVPGTGSTASSTATSTGR